MHGLQISSAALGKFDIREDEEQYVKLYESLDLLISAGYYRAKIQGLSAFDKIVGGMVWCISLCAQQVDVDLLYSENSTIGKKIFLTERIVQVLPKLKCPHALEPHQIQGLDCIHIFPVLHWLVKEAMEVKKKRGDEQQNFSVYQFHQERWQVTDDTDFGVRPVVKSRKVYKRMIRMRPVNVSATTGNDEAADSSLKDEESNEASTSTENYIKEPSRNEFVVCKNGDYASATIDAEGAICEAHRSVSPSSALEISTAENIGALREKLATFDLEKQSLIRECEEKEKRLNALKADANQLSEEIEQFNETVGAVDEKIVERLKALLEERDEIKASESSFKKDCRRQIDELDQQIEHFRSKSSLRNGGIAVNEDNQINDDEAERERLIAECATLGDNLLALNRAIFEMERQLELKPSQIELNQYQRRFVELHNQMSDKHGETKRYYTLYNTLLDIRNFVKREIDLLNSIDDSKNLALRDDYKDSFVENLQAICRSVEQSLDKILCDKRILQEQHDALAENLRTLVDRERLYMRTVVEFQQECQRNEELRAILEAN